MDSPLSPTAAKGPRNFHKSAEQINDFLAKLLILVVQNRISSRRAAILTYITNQPLHSLVAIKRGLANQPLELNWDGFPLP